MILFTLGLVIANNDKVLWSFVTISCGYPYLLLNLAAFLWKNWLGKLYYVILSLIAAIAE